MTYRDETGRARLTLFGKQIYCSTQATADCICKLEEALQAHEPRVMTLEEMRFKREVPVWFESHGTFRGRKGFWTFLGDVSPTTFTILLLPEDGIMTELSLSAYGKVWRCWLSRPTDAQREETAWQTK